MRNSSLVESGGADNVAGIKSVTDAMDTFPGARLRKEWRGGEGMVGERRSGGEAAAEAAVERGRVRMPV